MPALPELVSSPLDDSADGLADRWHAAMLVGDFERAWQQSDRVRSIGLPDPHRLWDGRPLAGQRVIVRCLHGFGDTVQMLAYAPRLKALAASVVYEVAPRMVALARCFDAVNEVITWGDAAPARPPAWDVQVEVMELPYILRTTLADLPLAARYCRLAVEARHAAAAPRIGLAWTVGEWNVSRQLPATLVEHILTMPGCEFWSLQQDAPPQALAGALRHDRAAGEDLVALARLIAGLDLVITADTLAAHLAGALGTPAWVLLQHQADWRWMAERDRSPWYPTLHLLRQPAPGDWMAVAENVHYRLQHLLKEKHA